MDASALETNNLNQYSYHQQQKSQWLYFLFGFINLTNTDPLKTDNFDTKRSVSYESTTPECKNGIFQINTHLQLLYRLWKRALSFTIPPQYPINTPEIEHDSNTSTLHHPLILHTSCWSGLTSHIYYKLSFVNQKRYSNSSCTDAARCSYRCRSPLNLIPHLYVFLGIQI